MMMMMMTMFPAAQRRVWQLLACAKPCAPVFVVLSFVAVCMYVLSYVTSVRLSSWIRKEIIIIYYYYYAL